jgi:outer membrane murein-binding lipoprotein Lpp
LVGVLDDVRDAVRNAGLLLLVELTTGANEDLRKIVAFEDVFGKVFTVIQSEGGLSEAGIVAQDCLTLLANLVRGSASNQTMFRESGCVKQLHQLLVATFPPDPAEAGLLAQNREKATWGTLQLMKLFFTAGESNTPPNQNMFYHAGIARLLCDISFSALVPPPIRASALETIALLIAGNPPLQEQFAGLQVVTLADEQQNAQIAQQAVRPDGGRPDAAATKTEKFKSEPRQSYIIEALLELCLAGNSADVGLRSAGRDVIQAYLSRHDLIKSHFLLRAIAGYDNRETAANVLTTMLQSPTTDVFALVLASTILQSLLSGNDPAKTALLGVKEGNEDEGEDVITAVQAMSSQLQSSLLQVPRDERCVTAYAGVLSVLLWDFPTGVNHFLAEGSSLVQTLIATVKAANAGVVVAGASAVLLGIVYEFSTKDSPIPRRTLAPLMQQKLGRANYLDALSGLRRDSAISNHQFDRETNNVAEMYLAFEYVDFFITEYARLRRAIDKDPGLEVLQGAADAGIDRDILDDLRQQVQTARDALAAGQQEAANETQKLEQSRNLASRDLQNANAELERLRKINQSLQQEHTKEVEKVHKQNEQKAQTLESQHQRAMVEVKQEAERRVHAALREQEARSAQKAQDLERKIAELGNSHRTEVREHKAAREQLETLSAKHTETSLREKDLAGRFEDLQQKFTAASQELQSARDRASRAESELSKASTEVTNQAEKIAEMTTQLNELQEEVKSRESELASERAGFADLEKELEVARSSAKKKSASEIDSAKLLKLQKDLDTANEAEKNAKEELESMLLVLSDIESKRDAYKKKFKALGGEISDDDEDEEEDADEDGDNSEDDVD